MLAAPMSGITYVVSLSFRRVLLAVWVIGLATDAGIAQALPCGELFVNHEMRISKIIDLRSDTVTLPTQEMRRFMFEAEVGDEGYNEDPQVRTLEGMASQLMGKKTAVFVPSGIMANQAALIALGQFEGSFIAARGSHIATTELEASTKIARLRPLLIGKNGRFSTHELESLITSMPPEERSRIKLVSVENTVAASGGAIIPYKEFLQIAEVTMKYGLPLHLDGARIFNASIETGVPSDVWGQSVAIGSFCLSKGLGAPVGSVIFSESKYEESLRKAKLLLGGRMRQSGFLAAAGIFALEKNLARLTEDHARASAFAKALGEAGFEVDFPETNIVLFRRPGLDTKIFLERAEKNGIKIRYMENIDSYRAVFHLGISDKDVERAVLGLRAAVQNHL